MITVNDTIAAGKAWLRARIDTGEHCPLCGQMAKMYKRKINSQMARSLINLHVGGTDFQHGPSLPGDSHEMSQLAWWGLIEEESRVRPDGGRAGWWRMTRKGMLFVQSRISVAKYARIYDSKVFGFEGDPVMIRDCLGSRFSYEELMRGE